jgi:predicted CopG family antitoxin
MKEVYEKFLKIKKNDKSVLELVLDDEANQSDEDFNVFDQIA